MRRSRVGGNDDMALSLQNPPSTTSAMGPGVLREDFQGASPALLGVRVPGHRAGGGIRAPASIRIAAASLSFVRSSRQGFCAGFRKLSAEGGPGDPARPSRVAGRDGSLSPMRRCLSRPRRSQSARASLCPIPPSPDSELIAFPESLQRPGNPNAPPLGDWTARR